MGTLFVFKILVALVALVPGLLVRGLLVGLVALVTLFCSLFIDPVADLAHPLLGLNRAAAVLAKAYLQGCILT